MGTCGERASVSTLLWPLGPIEMATHYGSAIPARWVSFLFLLSWITTIEYVKGSMFLIVCYAACVHIQTLTHMYTSHICRRPVRAVAKSLRSRSLLPIKKENCYLALWHTEQVRDTLAHKHTHTHTDIVYNVPSHTHSHTPANHHIPPYAKKT